MKTVHFVYARGVPDPSFQEFVRSVRDSVATIPGTHIADDTPVSTVSADLVIALDDYYTEDSHVQVFSRRSLKKPLLVLVQVPRRVLANDHILFSTLDDLTNCVERMLYPEGVPVTTGPTYN